MTRKIIIQFIALVASFFGSWLLLREVNFIDRDEILDFSRSSEKKLCEMMLETIRKNDRILKSEKIKAIVDSIGRRLCDSSSVKYDSIRVYIIVNKEVNAFTLPDRTMVIFTGLIGECKNPEELAGVMAHEIGHMEKNHVMKKLRKEVGLALLISLMDGGQHYEILDQITKSLSSSAFDRSYEKEADQFAVEALAHADIDPENMANFLFRFSGKAGIPENLVWISTHPDSKDRASEIIVRKKVLNYQSRPVIFSSWESIRMRMTEESD